MKIVEGLFLNAFFSVLLLSTVIGMGQLFLFTILRNSRKVDSENNLATYFVIGLAFYTVIIHLLATYRIEFEWFIFIACLFGLFSFLFFGFRQRQNIFKEKIAVLFVGTAIGIWGYLPGLVSLFNSNSSLGMVTRGNNDIAYYVAVASEFLKTGFVNSNHIASIDLNFAAEYGHYFSPTSLFTISNGLTGLQTWDTAMFVIIASFCFSWMSLVSLAKSLFNLSDKRMMALGYLASSIKTNGPLERSQKR
jgi:hypothetical protein